MLLIMRKSTCYEDGIVGDYGEVLPIRGNVRRIATPCVYMAAESIEQEVLDVLEILIGLSFRDRSFNRINAFIVFTSRTEKVAEFHKFLRLGRKNFWKCT